MTVVGTIWAYPLQRQIRVILSVATLSGLELNQPEFTFNEKPAEFTNKFSYEKVPTFEGTDGFKLIEGAPIARYLCTIGTEVGLLGSDVKEAALVDQWLHYAEHEIGASVYAIAGQIYGPVEIFRREALDKTTERLVRALKFLESHLAERSTAYVASDNLTLADLVVASTIFFGCRIALGIAERKQYPAIFAHYEKVAAYNKIGQYWGKDGWVDVPKTEPTKWT